MKKIFTLITILFSLTNCSVDKDTASINEDWYAEIKFADGFTDQIVIHIVTTDTIKSVTIDFPIKNIGSIWGHDAFSDVDAGKTTIDKDNISFIAPDLELDFEGKINSTKSEIVGQLVLSGNPFDLVFTKNKLSNPKNPSTIEQVPGLSSQAGSPDLEMKTPISKSNSLFTEELTWLEIRDAIKGGKTTIIIPTGGIEQNGSYLATGKHNYVLKNVTDSIAHKLGNALIAPVIKFVPEGNHSPPTSHMKYSGTISLQESTYEQLLKDIASSYKAHGFKIIIFIGDSGGNQWGMYVVSKELNSEWKNDNCKVLYIPEYYDNYRVAQWLKTQGIKEVDTGVHDNFQYTSQMMALDPTLVRMKQRIASGNFTVNGINLQPIDKTIELGKKLCNYQADITVDAINKALKNK
jgi:creatinine amidohydrolase/Fe(II)-dependent formamide hydrolase-like protein